MADLNIFGTEFADVSGFKIPDINGDIILYTENDGSGGGSAISVVDTPDSHGGTIRSITSVDISDTTATAEDVAQGKYFYTSDGIKTLGTANDSGSTPEITISTSGAVSQALQPDTVYHFTSDALTSLTITFAGTATNQYHFDFISPSTAVTLSLPSTVIMPVSFGVEANSKYEIDIYNNYGVYAVWVYEEVSS